MQKLCCCCCCLGLLLHGSKEGSAHVFVRGSALPTFVRHFPVCLVCKCLDFQHLFKVEFAQPTARFPLKLRIHYRCCIFRDELNQIYTRNKHILLAQLTNDSSTDDLRVC